jgi:hypothetical protein
MALPQDLRYELKPVSASARQYLQNIAPTSGSTFSPGNVIRINIPCGRPNTAFQPHQSYLKFSVNVAGNDAVIDHNAQSIIQRLTVYHGSNLLEDEQQYSVMVAALHDMMTDGSEAGRQGAINAGFQTSAVGTTSNTVCRNGVSMTAGTAKTFCVPLVSGVVGTLLGKNLPVGEMGAGDLRIEIELAPFADALRSAAHGADPTGYTVSDVEYVCSFVEVSQQAMDDIRRAHGGRYAISSESYRNYTESITAGAGEKVVLIPAKFSSLKTLICALRADSNSSNLNANTVSSRAKGGMSQYQFRLAGGLSLPSQPVDCADGAQPIAELQRAYHALGVSNSQTMFNTTQFNADDGKPAGGAIQTDANHGSYLFGINLDAFGASSHLLEQGTDTLGAGNIFLNMTQGAANVASQLSTFAHYDLLLQVDENGVMSAKY